MASAVMSDLMLGIKNCWRERTSLVPAIPSSYIVEASFLSKYFTSDCLRMSYDDTGKLHISAYGREETRECHRIVITGDDTIDGPTRNALCLHYFGGKGFYAGLNYGLIILDENDNILYWREVGQDPHTEWQINRLAGDLKDKTGSLIFEGEPVSF